MKTIIYHNPRCSKSREALNILLVHAEDVEVINYLKAVFSEKELIELISKLGIKPEMLVRKNEPLFKENFSDKKYTDKQWVDILINNPSLIERPIVVKGKNAVIGRPLQNVIDIL